MNYILIANTTTVTIDYVGLTVTLVAILIIIAGIRGIIRGSRKKEAESLNQTPPKVKSNA